MLNHSRKMLVFSDGKPTVTASSGESTPDGKHFCSSRKTRKLLTLVLEFLDNLPFVYLWACCRYASYLGTSSEQNVSTRLESDSTGTHAAFSQRFHLLPFRNVLAFPGFSKLFALPLAVRRFFSWTGAKPRQAEPSRAKHDRIVVGKPSRNRGLGFRFLLSAVCLLFAKSGPWSSNRKP